ncbi:MAG TPA: hypothetical protein VGJ75_13550 [Dongiaceae bacterium]
MMKHELKQLRRSIEARIRAGDVPDWSWPQHVQLIEAIDAVLHDLSLMPDRAGRTHWLSDRVHLLEAPARESRVSASIERLKARHH